MILLFTAISSVPGAVLFYIRNTSEGVHVVTVLAYPLIMWGLLMLRRYLSIELTAMIFAVVHYVCFVDGITSRGIVGPVFFFLMVGVLVLALVLKTRDLIVITGLFFAGAVGIQLAYFLGLFALRADPLMVVNDPLHWTIYSTMVLYATGFLVYATHRHLNEIREAYRKLEVANEQLTYTSEHDALTNLLNIRATKQRSEQAIAHALRNNKKLAVLFVDLDGFKKLNDAYGHLAGDSVLKELAGFLRDALRQEDIIGRVGGDEFVITLTNVADQTSVEEIAGKIMNTLSMPVHIQDKHIPLTASIGIAQYPEDGDTFDTLKGAADAAMYQAKKAGKNCFRFYATSP